MQRQSDIEAFYRILEHLEARMGGRRRLGDCHGRMPWPERGVYFFFEPDEYRASSSTVTRVVRVGTHALKAGSRATIWNRLSQHRGTANPYGGNHRGSIFRLLVGQALMHRDPSLKSNSWGRGSTAQKEIRQGEVPLEQKVSDFLGEMTLVVLPVPDLAGPNSLRGLIERNSIALLSAYNDPEDDQPREGWLGSHSGRPKVRRSGLWNNNHVDESYDPAFLSVLEALVVNSSGSGN